MSSMAPGRFRDVIFESLMPSPVHSPLLLLLLALYHGLGLGTLQTPPDRKRKADLPRMLRIPRLFLRYSHWAECGIPESYTVSISSGVQNSDGVHGPQVVVV